MVWTLCEPRGPWRHLFEFETPCLRLSKYNTRKLFFSDDDEIDDKPQKKKKENIRHATKFNCRTCCRFFTQKEFLDHHMKTYHSDEVFQCPHCPKQIVSKLYFDRHVAWVHKTAKTVQCEICSRMFKTPRCLKKHKLAFHEKKKPKVCDICGLSLPLSSYRYHMANEHGEGKDFTCDKCDESFAYNFQLQRHICAASQIVAGTKSMFLNQMSVSRFTPVL